MITVQVFFFSTIRARVGLKETQIQLPIGSRVEDLKKEIARLYPDAAATIVGMLASVNQVFSDDNTELPDQAWVAFFPYVTGGSTFLFPVSLRIANNQADTYDPLPKL